MPAKVGISAIFPGDGSPLGAEFSVLCGFRIQGRPASDEPFSSMQCVPRATSVAMEHNMAFGDQLTEVLLQRVSARAC